MNVLCRCQSGRKPKWSRPEQGRASGQPEASSSRPASPRTHSSVEDSLEYLYENSPVVSDSSRRKLVGSLLYQEERAGGTSHRPRQVASLGGKEMLRAHLPLVEERPVDVLVRVLGPEGVVEVKGLPLDLDARPLQGSIGEQGRACQV